MRVGIDVTYAAKREGTGTYIRNLVSALARHPEIELVTFARPRPAFLRLLPRPIARPINGIFSLLWLQIAVPLGARRQQLDLFHAPAFVAPLLLPCPLVLTIHDAVPFTLSQRNYRLWGLYMRLLVGPSARRAARVIAVSAHAAGVLAQLFALSEGKVRAIPHGVSPLFRPLTPNETLASTIPATAQPFLLFVGASDERKNYTTLLAALRILRERGITAPQLLVTGNPTAEFRALADEANARATASVRFVDYVGEETLVALYNRACAFIFPSRYEGFGLPILEAMACGCPVICSNATSLPEVAGDAALQVAPDDAPALADAIATLLTDREMAARLAAAGLVRAREFTWARTAERTIAVYRDTG